MPPARAIRSGRLLLVSNRLPVTAHIENNEVTLQPSTGGLATGLRSVHEREQGLWIGWSGLTDQSPPGAHRVAGVRLGDVGAVPLSLTEEEVGGYYRGYCNSALWPVLHGCLRAPVIAQRDWELYRRVNYRYADLVRRHYRPGDRIWIHDFHLMLLPRLLRERLPDARIGFFFHTPFPHAGSFTVLKQAPELLQGVLGADLIGLHVREYGRHLNAAVRTVLSRTPPQVITCPMGIDVPYFTAWARKPAVSAGAARIREECAGPLFVGIDRLDYTKGIPERLRAFERLLQLVPGLRGRARLIQIVVPSREHTLGYSDTRVTIERLVQRINQRFARGSWIPVEYRHGGVSTEMLVTLYRAADVMLVTALCDGMNLVAKEFVASREDEDGVLLLSRRAGAAAELHAAVLIEPADLDDLVRGFRLALEMTPSERRFRMRYLRQAVQEHDLFRWSQCFLDALGQPQHVGRTAGRLGPSPAASPKEN